MIDKIGTTEPRGLRNNNPGNIRRSSTPWRGLSPTQLDPDFLQFISPEYGIRAIARILRTYEKRGLHTLAAIIREWAPPAENDTPAYVTAVCHECELEPDDPIILDDVMPNLVKAIIRHENGCQPYTDFQIHAGIVLT